jgi:ATP-dependent DNA helicase DinG
VGEVVSMEAYRAETARTVDLIDAAYDALAKLPDFRVRDGQKALSRAMFEAFMEGTPFAAEAPTGTGKTIAYLIAALTAQTMLSEGKRTPVVVATATIGLQEQVILGDLPKLVNAGLLAPGDAVIAKGRGRYFCTLSAERAVAAAQAEGQFDFFDENANDATQSVKVAERLLEQFHGRAWDGDRDELTGDQPSDAVWSRLQASSDTCVGRRCEFFESCAFFRERAKLAYARVIVANQDLVLADLKMSAEGQDPLFPGDRYILVLDEAHNLPDKALEAGGAQIDVEAAQKMLLPLPAFGSRLFRDPDLNRMLDTRGLRSTDFEPGLALQALARLAAEIRTFPIDEDFGVMRLGRKDLPDTLQRVLQEAHDRVGGLKERFSLATTALRNSTLPERKPGLAPLFGDVLFQASFFTARLNEIASALNLVLEGKNVVRWIEHDAARAKIFASPLEGADVLNRLLWQSERVKPALVSATLRTFGSFTRFSVKSGLPNFAKTHTVDPIFPYEKSQIIMARMRHSPRQYEQEGFYKEVSEVMPQFIRANEGTLVLFPSRKLMNQAIPALQAHFPGQVLSQGDLPFSRLLSTHRRRIDQGRGSILCGLATLAEGLDLPGKYCTHVVIVALPFAVPTSPVELELQELLGKRYFRERSMPDALTHLVQMTGRLLRRETDVGRITVLDRRLRETRWGREMLFSLPPFKKRVEHPEDRQDPKGTDNDHPIPLRGEAET